MAEDDFTAAPALRESDRTLGPCAYQRWSWLIAARETVAARRPGAAYQAQGGPLPAGPASRPSVPQPVASRPGGCRCALAVGVRLRQTYRAQGADQPLRLMATMLANR